MVLMSSIGMRTGKRPTRPPLVIFGLALSIRQRSVEGPPASSVTRTGKPPTPGNPAFPRTPALPSAPAAGPESAVVIGLRITWSGLATPPLDCITRKGLLRKPFASASRVGAGEGPKRGLGEVL